MDAIIYAGLGGFGAGALIALLVMWRGAVKATALKNEKLALEATLREELRLQAESWQAEHENWLREREDAVRLNAEKAALQQQIAQGKEDMAKMETQFENLANKIFEDKSEKFKKQSQESLNELLNPLRDRLMEFHKKVEDSFGQQAKEQYSLKEQIKNIVEVHERMTVQTESLTKALKGDSKTQGDWGEVILENILESSGLRKGHDYIVQGAGLDIRHVETGQHQKPDVVVKLPENKHVIIDSKLSLRHYEKFCAETDDAQRGGHLTRFLAAVRDRVKEMGERRYQDTDALGTPEIVLMFMPIEGAFALALQQDRELHQFAWNKKVAIVCPSTLFATLKTISSLWRLELQNNNAQEIARQGGALYDKIESFVGDMQTLGKQLKTVEGTYDRAMNKLSAGRGNILGRTEKLKELGAKTSKALPTELLDMDGQDDDDAREGYMLIAADEEEKRRA